ncbi:MAG: phosphoribosylformylglycinamidine synthase subunit PurL [Ktedonobacterales bacterium]|nr:phosphoribosylformylglycinamidine synthase subunit PurL [Ktedonobacterales bacterium]
MAVDLAHADAAYSDADLRGVALVRTEYHRIVELLGRIPNSVELGIFGAMWSEHCGYKNSRALLKRFPTTGPRVLLGPGAENAGAIDAGHGLAVVFKIESHNHPSAVEPFQGAATGVGGILRDIFTMGARPVALLDSLRFGDPASERTRYLFDGVVGGIGHYGNCMGIPTVGGEIYFDATYGANPLVNAMCVGVVPTDRILPARAGGAGNPVLLVGASTGRDGIHGATFASVSDPNSTQRSAVQVGNPFLEKLLMEACLELRDTGWLVGLQDLGAAGLTSATVEAAHKGGCGLDLDVAQVARREDGMTPYEIMLSESQERMLAIVHDGHEADVQRVFEKWGLHSNIIGHVINEPVLRVRDGENVAAEIPTAYLTDDVPMYIREGVANPKIAELWQFDATQVQPRDDLGETLQRMLSAPDVASRRTVWNSYDHMVGANTVIAPGFDAAVLRLRTEDDQDTGVTIAIATDGNGRLVYLDPYNGGAMTVAEAARNCACTGATPTALTNCLNFGNPEKLDVYYQMATAIDGMSAAARALGTPVVSGNVSLYNETEGEAIYPSPVIGMIGVLEGHPPRPSAAGQPGDVLALLGPWRDDPVDLAGSTYLATMEGIVAGRPPQLDLAAERALQDLLTDPQSFALLASAHDCSDGGLGVALAEWCTWAGLGITPDAHLMEHISHPLAVLFGEAPSRVVVSVAPAHYAGLVELATAHGVPLTQLGIVGGDQFRFAQAHCSLADLRAAHEYGLGEALGKTPVAV